MNEQNHKAPSSFLDRVIARQDELEITDSEMDKLMGYRLGRLWRRIKVRRFPLSLSDVPQLAKALNLDAASLMRHAMQEMLPDFLELMDEHLRPSELSEREARLIKQFRKVTAGKGLGPIVYYEVTTSQTLIIEGV
ncbi:hypothetical protein LJR084_002458 [Variovorax sp. LjRoot84]|uniref:hypothetical protein n=1 Tax=Variovorax sp. LjRoot84 TaxID=3342340 RepID=UPI003ED01F9D